MFVDENLFYTNVYKCAKAMVTLNSPLTFDAFTRYVICVIMRSYFREAIWFQINLGNVTIWEMSQYCGFASVSSVLV